jgi:3D (Asp-Asp-Asp) domain-containing protein
VAADTDVLPFGTKVIIDGNTYIVQDRGGAIKGNRIDLYFDSHQEALNFGRQTKEVTILN